MNSMFEFFDRLLGWFEVFGEYLFNSISATIAALGYIGSAMGLPTALVGYMPGIIGASVTAVAALVLIRFLLGK